MSAYAAVMYARRHFKIFFKDPHVVNTRYDEPDLEDMESGLPVYREDTDPVHEAAPEKAPENPEADLEALTTASAVVNVPQTGERPMSWTSKIFAAIASTLRWRR